MTNTNDELFRFVFKIQKFAQQKENRIINEKNASVNIAIKLIYPTKKKVTVIFLLTNQYGLNYI